MRTLNDHLRSKSVNSCPEWRWLRAGSIRSSRRRTLAAEQDTAVQHAVSFLAAIEKCKNELDWDDLREDRPDECEAYMYWVDPDMYNRPSARLDLKEVRRQAALEAYLLTGAPHTTVASRMGMTTPAVAIYETWFYDFRSKLNIPHWIGTHGLRGDVAGQNGISFEHLVRIFGLNYGIEAVDDLLRGTNYSAATKKALRQETSDHLMKGSAIASRNYINPISLLEAARGQLEIEDRRHQFDVQVGAEFRDKAQETYYETVESELGGMNWAVVEIPEKVEEFLPSTEKRLSVQLGYEPDLSIATAITPSSD
jgi:hypothetical protein